LCVNLKNCVHHITRNVLEKFSSLKDKPLRSLIFTLQSACCFKDYIKALTAIGQRPIKSPGLNPILGYLMQLHPSQWSVWGYLEVTDEDDRIMKFIWQDIPTYGEKTSLFGTRSTNGVEGEMNALNHQEIRDCLPYDIILSCCVSCIETKKKLFRI
jgi:hypothetical protein